MGLAGYAEKTGLRTAVLGLSGGVDSAVTACLAAEALGAGNVMGVGMPGPFSAPESLEDARRLAKNLGLGFEVVPIGPVYEAYLAMLRPVLSGPPVRRHGGERPGAHPRQRADGDLEQARPPRADDGEQVGALRRLLHALRRHVAAGSP